MFRRDIFNLDLINNEAGGIIALKGYTGHDAWMTKLHNVPQDMDCSLIDIDKDNLNDCIVVGENGLLAAIEPLYGNVLWYMHDHSANMKPSKLDFPIMFPDVNGDDINELLVPCSLSDRRNSLVLVSGRRGNILGKPLNFTGCLDINSVSLEKDWSITYICHVAGDKEAVKSLSFQEVCNGVADLNEVKIHTSQPKQHHRQTAEANKGWSLTVGGNRLVGDNSVQCTLLINLTDQHTGVARWNYSHEQMYGMMPTMFTFKKPSGESAVGFIFKLWEWVAGTSGCSLNTDFMFCNQPGQTNHEGLVYEDADPRNMIPGSEQTFRSSHDNCPAMNTIIEHILVLTFNSTHVVELNISQSDVIQLCSSLNTTDGEKLCQPSIQHQQQSVLIADLDEDGSQELVSYLTTYIPRSQIWQLQTTVRMGPITNITNS
uniref:FAM234A/B beta-propeller domain-containing protein n=1 Tax=Timema tahoe TaxID=61484 RepID=A0A7R9IM55_9NEOP|nr:unnamed protein product [Timema tahoe]